MMIDFNHFLLDSRTLLQFAKKKRKRSDSGSDVDLDVTPPPSPKGEDEMIEKRRSGRNTNKRKKYTDDVDFNFSDEESVPPEAKAAGAKAGAVPAEGDAAADAGAEKGDAVAAAADGKDAAAVAQSGDTSNDAQVPESSGPNYAFIVSSFCILFHRSSLRTMLAKEVNALCLIT